MVKIKISENTTLAIFQVYAPTLGSDSKDIKNFYNSFEEFHEKEKEEYSIIMGDFNAKIGGEIEMNGCTGSYAIGITNKSGFKLGKFCLRNNLKIANTFFNLLPEEKLNWKSPDGKTKNEIDHLLTNRISLITDNKIINNFLFSSDHRPVASTLTFQEKKTLPPPP